MKISFCLLFILVFQLASGQNPTSVPNPPATDPSTQQSSSNSNMFELSPQIDYVYDPTGKKDPFKPYKAPRIRGDNRPTTTVDPLSVVEVTQLQLVAVMWNTQKPRAVVKDQQNRSYILFKNMRVGRNDGVVVDIREGEIVIVEKFDDGFGNTVREARVLEIKPSDSAAGG